MNTALIRIGFLLVLSLALTVVACRKDDDTENEVITTVVVHLQAVDGSFDREFTWNDSDGDGGNPPAVDDITLPANKEFNARVHFYDRSKSPEVDITEEVEEESDEHLIVYKVSGAVNLTIMPTDTDKSGRPFRLKTRWTAGAASTGSVLITLRHEPDKSSPNLDLTGSVDAEVEFPVRIQ